MDRRSFVVGAGATAAALTVPHAGAQEVYPSRSVTIINPFPPGGAVDVVCRPFAAVLEGLLKQPVVIETKAGAAGAVGAQFAASAKPDGYTLLAHLPSISGFEAVDRLFGWNVSATITTTRTGSSLPLIGTRWRHVTAASPRSLSIHSVSAVMGTRVPWPSRSMAQ